MTERIEGTEFNRPDRLNRALSYFAIGDWDKALVDYTAVVEFYKPILEKEDDAFKQRSTRLKMICDAYHGREARLRTITQLDVGH